MLTANAEAPRKSIVIWQTMKLCRIGGPEPLVVNSPVTPEMEPHTCFGPLRDRMDIEPSITVRARPTGVTYAIPAQRQRKGTGRLVHTFRYQEVV